MNRDQAACIFDHLLDAAHGLDEARAAISAVIHTDRQSTASELEAAVIKLNSELLRLMLERFSDFKPLDEFWKISSALEWEQVRLPPSVSEAEIDRIIFSMVRPRWLKTARIVGDALRQCQETGLPISDEILGARIRALVEADRLEGRGDPRMWGHSEVRLKS